MWSFVGKRKHKVWLWIALDAETREVVALHVGDRSRQSAQTLWPRLLPRYRECAILYTDEWEAYQEALPSTRHRIVHKGSGLTNYIERFNNTLRQRLARLTRETLSFYFAEAERDFISVRTQQGLAAARASGKQLGRPKGSRDKERVLDPYHEQIKEYLQLGLPLRRIRTIVSPQLDKPIAYNA